MTTKKTGEKKPVTGNNQQNTDDDDDNNELDTEGENQPIKTKAPERNKLVSNLKNTLKRPHTSFASLGGSKRADERANVEFDVNDEETVVKPVVEPVRDQRYLSLLNSMNTMWTSSNKMPAEEMPTSNDPFRRVDTLIRRNKALYGRIEYEAEQSKVYKIGNENLKLFERLIAGVW
jgi:hypothetical protein